MPRLSDFCASEDEEKKLIDIGNWSIPLGSTLLRRLTAA
jgi:hypothetical protein